MKGLCRLGLLMVWIVSTVAQAQTAASDLIQANHAYAAKDFTKAIAYYQKVAQADPGSASAYQGLGNCHYQLGEKAEALADYEKALGFNPNNSGLTQAIESLRNSISSRDTVRATPSPLPGPSNGPDLRAESKKEETHPENSGEEMKAYQLNFSKRAHDRSKANKDRENWVVLDWVNGEIWNQGFRFKISQLDGLAQVRKWKIEKTLEKRDPAGHPRWLYKIGNMSLLRYKNREGCIFEIKPPSQPGDFEMETAEGISFQSSGDDLQDAIQNPYFTYEGEQIQENERILKYKHSNDLAFDDKLEVFLDPSGKMIKIRYGILDEH